MSARTLERPLPSEQKEVEGMSFTLLALLLSAASLRPAGAAEAIYRDSQGRFTLLVPPDWTATATADGVRVSHGEAMVQVAIVERGGTTADLLSLLVEQARAQHKNFSESGRGPCGVGGHDGACSLVSGVAPKGYEVVIRLAAMVRGGRRYVLMAEVPPRRHLSALKDDLVRIEKTFSLGGGAAGPTKPDQVKLDALEAAYKAGVLTKAEYEAKKRDLLRAGTPPLQAPTPPPMTAGMYRDPEGRFTLRVPEGWTARTIKDGVSVTHGKAYADLMLFEGKVTEAAGLLSFLAKQIERQAKSFTEIKVNPCRFGDQEGACGLYSGVDPRGMEAFFRVAAMAEGGIGYALMVVVPQRDFSALKVDLDRIEQSFALGGTGPRWSR